MKHAAIYEWGGAGTVPVVFNFGGGGGAGPSATARENERLNNMLLKKQLAESGKMSGMGDFKIPPAPVYAPPPSSTSADAAAAANETRQQAVQRRGIQSTIIADRKRRTSTAVV